LGPFAKTDQVFTEDYYYMFTVSKYTDLHKMGLRLAEDLWREEVERDEDDGEDRQEGQLGDDSPVGKMDRSCRTRFSFTFT